MLKIVLFLLFTACFSLSHTQPFLNTKNTHSPHSNQSKDQKVLIENKGQWPSQVSHMAKIGGGAVWLEKNKAKFDDNLLEYSLEMRKYSSVNDVVMILSSSGLSLYLFTVSFYIHFVNNISLVYI